MNTEQQTEKGRKKNIEFLNETIDSEKVQLWSPRIMLTVISKEEAVEMVLDGRCKIITGHAIAFYGE